MIKKCSRIRERLRAFPADESGQSMIFTALTFFALLIMVGMIVGVGDVTTDQMRLQNAADSAAYSGTAVEADCLAQMAWLNEGMAVIYGKAITNSVANITNRTSTALNLAWWDPSTAVDVYGVNLGLTAAQIADPEVAVEAGWYEKGRDWYSHLSKAQRLIAIAAPMLIKNQVYQSAHANYFQEKDSGDVNRPLRIAIFPNPGNSGNSAWEFYPEDGSFHDAVLEHNPQTLSAGSKGWKITSETDPGYCMEMMHLVIDESVASSGIYNEWHIVIDEPDTTDKSGASTTNSLDSTIKSTDYSPFNSVSSVAGTKKYTGTMYQSGDYEIIINSDSHHVKTYAETNGGEIVLVEIEPGSYRPDGNSGGDSRDVIEKIANGTIIDGDEYSLDDEGNYSKNGESENGEITINGMSAPVSFPEFLNGIRLSWPLELFLDGKVAARFTDKMSLYFKFNNAIRWIRADDTQAWVRELTTANPDRNWRSISGQQGRKEHRLFEYPDETLTNDGRYKYEIADSGSWMREMSFLKLGLRGLIREGLINDSTLQGYVPLAGVPLEYNPRDNNSNLVDGWKSDDDRWRNYEAGVWDIMQSSGLLWCCPARTPRNNSEAQKTGAFGGFFDLNTGQLANSDEDGDGTPDAGTSPYTYSVTRSSSYNPGISFSETVYLKRKIYSGSTLIELYNLGHLWMVGSATYLPADDNPLWNLYRSLTTEATAVGSHDDDTTNDAGIAISGSNKNNCGFYVIKKYTNLVDEELKDFAAKIYALANAEKKESFTLDQGITLTEPFFVYRDGGGIYLCIYDPYGAAAAFLHQPKYPWVNNSSTSSNGLTDCYAADAGAVNGNLGSSPTWDQMKAVIASVPAVVRRYAYHGGSKWLAGDQNSADFLSSSVAMGTDISSIVFNEDAKGGGMSAKPLELTSQVFRKPLAVCLFMPERMGWLAPLFGRSREDFSEAQKRAGQGNPLYLSGDGNNQKWNSGHFVFSAARVFMKEPDGGSGFMTNFAYYDGNLSPADLSVGACELSQAAMGYPDGINQITNYEMRGYRQNWLASTNNFFELVWTAQLVPFNSALAVHDVEPYEELEEDINSAADYLINKYTEAATYNHYSRRDGWMQNCYTKDNAWSYESTKANDSWKSITAPPLQGANNGNNLNWRNRVFEDLVRH